MLQWTRMDAVIKKYKTLQEFFQQRIHDAASTQHIELSTDVEFYLVCLMARFARSEHYYERDEKGKNELRALALKLADALYASEVDEQYIHLKSLADTALYHTGVFYDGLYNQVVDVDYYINMGGAAYQSLANLNTHRTKSLANTFDALGRKFAELAEVLHLCCEHEKILSDVDLLRLLDRYLKTGSKKAKEILEEKGILLDVGNEYFRSKNNEQ